MKKAKVLIPSLAALCFSAVACVTGSVAWFVSVTTANITAGNFQVQSADGGMNITTMEGIGTKVVNTNADSDHTIYENPEDTSSRKIGFIGNGTAVKADSYTPETGDPVENTLTHGSFDHTADKVWTCDKFDPYKYLEIGAGVEKTKANEESFKMADSDSIYHIFSWEVIFNYEASSASNIVNLYFDPTSTATYSSLVDDDTARGFRIAFINEADSSRKLVWSPLQADTYNHHEESTPTAAARVVGSSATSNYSTGSNGDLLFSGDSTVEKITGSTGSSARKDCLGQFDGSVHTITIRCIAWYEGLDDAVTTKNVANAVGANLLFYLKGNQAA